MNSGHFTSWSCSDGKEMYKQAQCTCIDVVLLIKNIERFRSRCQQLRQFVTTKESFYLKGKKVQLPRPILVWDTNMADVRGGRACKGSIVFVISALS